MTKDTKILLFSVFTNNYNSFLPIWIKHVSKKFIINGNVDVIVFTDQPEQYKQFQDDRTRIIRFKYEYKNSYEHLDHRLEYMYELLKEYAIDYDFVAYVQSNMILINPLYHYSIDLFIKDKIVFSNRTNLNIRQLDHLKLKPTSDLYTSNYDNWVQGCLFFGDTKVLLQAYKQCSEAVKKDTQNYDISLRTIAKWQDENYLSSWRMHNKDKCVIKSLYSWEYDGSKSIIFYNYKKDLILDLKNTIVSNEQSANKNKANTIKKIIADNKLQNNTKKILLFNIVTKQYKKILPYWIEKTAKRFFPGQSNVLVFTDDVDYCKKYENDYIKVLGFKDTTTNVVEFYNLKIEFFKDIINTYKYEYEYISNIQVNILLRELLNSDNIILHKNKILINRHPDDVDLPYNKMYNPIQNRILNKNSKYYVPEDKYDVWVHANPIIGPSYMMSDLFNTLYNMQTNDLDRSEFESINIAPVQDESYLNAYIAKNKNQFEILNQSSKCYNYYDLENTGKTLFCNMNKQYLHSL